MDRYQRIEKPRPESTINENEIRITTQGLIRNYISYATSLLQEKHAREIVLKAMGQAISKTVAIAEIMKKRIPELHQDTSISSVSITDVWEPIEEGLVPLEMTRHVSMISISLSTRVLNKNSPGYQAPLHEEQPKQQKKYQPPQYYQPQPTRQPPSQYNDDSYGRGRGRGRGRGQSWGRGGYDGYGNYGGYQGYGNNQGYRNNQGYASNLGHASNQGYANSEGYANNQENGGWNNNWSYGDGGRGSWGYRGPGDRGRGAGGRGYGRGRGRVGGRGRGNQA